MRYWNGVLAAAVSTAVSVTAASAAIVKDFEDNSTAQFSVAGTGVTQQIITPASGPNTSKVLDVTAAGFNQTGNYNPNLTFDIYYGGTSASYAAFLANNVLEFDYQAAPSSATDGYNQLYAIILNGPNATGQTNAGYKTIGGSSVTGSPNVTSYAPFTGQIHHFSYDYSAFKASLSATPGYLQLSFLTQQGGSAPADFYLDNFAFTSTPEPASLSVLGLAAVGGLARRRRA